ncbi:MAG: hypothetical protein LBR15_02915, partial [Methanobrevibacter sp.]|nr:hypothetical protein [Candidatus Methanovirga australis]
VIIRTPSMSNIGAMQLACIGNHVTDAQLCIVQCDPCFTCTDRAVEIVDLNKQSSLDLSKQHSLDLNKQSSLDFNKKTLLRRD